jgi:hypothetical protein
MNFGVAQGMHPALRHSSNFADCSGGCAVNELRGPVQIQQGRNLRNYSRATSEKQLPSLDGGVSAYQFARNSTNHDVFKRHDLMFETPQLIRGDKGMQPARLQPLRDVFPPLPYL